MNEDSSAPVSPINPPVICVPSISVSRNTFGLLTNISYVFNEDGLIDWRRMIKPGFLVPNARKTKETDVTKLEESELIILLGGLKYLAQIRGYSSIYFGLSSPSMDYAAATCTIDWIPNYETEGRSITTSALADAHERNTEGFARDYLAAIAENRAFARCVRNFLRINIVSDEELKDGSEKPKDENPSDPTSLLKTLMIEKNVPFEKLQARLIKDGLVEAQDYRGIEDIPAPKMYELIQLLKKSRKKAKS